MLRIIIEVNYGAIENLNINERLGQNQLEFKCLEGRNLLNVLKNHNSWIVITIRASKLLFLNFRVNDPGIKM